MIKSPLCFCFCPCSSSQVNASVKVKARGSGAPLASGGTRSCVAVCAPPSVPGISPSTPTPACVSAGRAHSRVCGRARSSTTTPAGRRARRPGVCPRQVSILRKFPLSKSWNFSALSSLWKGASKEKMSPLGVRDYPKYPRWVSANSILRIPSALSQKSQ